MSVQRYFLLSAAVAIKVPLKKRLVVKLRQILQLGFYQVIHYVTSTAPNKGSVPTCFLVSIQWQFREVCWKNCSTQPWPTKSFLAVPYHAVPSVRHQSGPCGVELYSAENPAPATKASNFVQLWCKGGMLGQGAAANSIPFGIGVFYFLITDHRHFALHCVVSNLNLSLQQV